MVKLSLRVGDKTSPSVQRPLNNNSATAVPFIQNDDVKNNVVQNDTLPTDKPTELGVTDEWGNQTLTDEEIHDLYWRSPETQRLINHTFTNLWNDEMNKIREEEQRQSNSKSQLEERIKALEQDKEDSIKKIWIAEKERDKMTGLYKHVVKLYEKQVLELQSATEKLDWTRYYRDTLSKKNNDLIEELKQFKLAKRLTDFEQNEERPENDGGNGKEV